MRRLMLAGCACIALFGRAEAQQMVGGPPLQMDLDMQVTWQGNTQYGATVYANLNDGRKAVFWRPQGSGWVYYKASDGEMGSVPANDQSTQAPAYQAPAQAYQPQQQLRPNNGYSTAGYDYTLQQAPRPAPAPRQYQPTYDQQQAAYAFRMFGMMMCAASGRC